MGNTISQLFPPRPRFTDKNVPDLSGRTYLVTGANTGVGKEVARILYSKNARVWVAARSEAKAVDAIKDIRSQHETSSGSLNFLELDLSDLTTIPGSVQTFLRTEKRLDVLFNNAGVMIPPQGSKTKQGYELQLGVNCVGHFLLTKLLLPTMQATAKNDAPPNSVRVVWVSSSAADVMSPPDGVELDKLTYHEGMNVSTQYGVSKAGNYYQGTELAKRMKKDNIISVPLNPGNLLSELDRTSPWYIVYGRRMLCYPPINGAYTEIFAAFSPEITINESGAWVVPWGRFLPIRDNLRKGSIAEAEGGTGIAAKFWEWSEEQVKPYIPAANEDLKQGVGYKHS